MVPAQQGYLSACKLLIKQYSANPNAIVSKRSPLHAAVLSDQIDVVRYLTLRWRWTPITGVLAATLLSILLQHMAN